MTANEQYESFEAQFRPVLIPAGTPDRKRLWKESQAEAHARACLPENITRRLELLAALKRERRSAKLRAAASRRKNDPEVQARLALYAQLRKRGFKRERSACGSTYYHKSPDLTVRVSDHDVPMTYVRQYNRDNGGFTWANNWKSFVMGEDVSEWLQLIDEHLSENA